MQHLKIGHIYNFAPTGHKFYHGEVIVEWDETFCETYERAVAQNDLRLVQLEVKLDDMSVSVPVHHLWVWGRKHTDINGQQLL